MRPLIQVYSKFDVSGIQTQMLFLANEQAALGGISVIYSRKGGLEKHLDSKVLFVESSNSENYVSEIIEFISVNRLYNPILWASHPYDLSKLYKISASLNRRGIPCSITCGVYHPRACFKPEDSRLTEAICRFNFHSADPHHIYFMSDSVMQGHSSRWPELRTDLKILPVVFPRKEANNELLGVNILKIVSIGRLVPWKAYNISIPKICKYLLKAKLDFDWVVYGDGALLDGLKETAQAENLISVLSFRGGLDFNRIDYALDDAHLFVGMGTSMLEAALRGIPCIVAVDGEESGTYGFLHEIPLGNVGEKMSTPPIIKISDKILEFHLMTEDEKKLIGEKCHAAALSQTSSPDEIIQYFQKLPEEKPLGFKKIMAVFLMDLYNIVKKIKARFKEII